MSFQVYRYHVRDYPLNWTIESYKELTTGWKDPINWTIENLKKLLKKERVVHIGIDDSMSPIESFK